MMELEPRQIIRFEQGKCRTPDPTGKTQRPQECTGQCGFPRSKTTRKVEREAWAEACSEYGCQSLGRSQATQKTVDLRGVGLSSVGHGNVADWRTHAKNRCDWHLSKAIGTCVNLEDSPIILDIRDSPEPRWAGTIPGFFPAEGHGHFPSHYNRGCRGLG